MDQCHTIIEEDQQRMKIHSIIIQESTEDVGELTSNTDSKRQFYCKKKIIATRDADEFIDKYRLAGRLRLFESEWSKVTHDSVVQK